VGGERFDLVFSDPPYALRAAQATLDGLQSAICWRPARAWCWRPIGARRRPYRPGARPDDERRYGDTRVLIYSNSRG